MCYALSFYSCHVYVTHAFVHWFIAVLRVAGAMQKSTEVMKAMNSLVKIPEIQATMRELSKEMMTVRTWTLLQIFCSVMSRWAHVTSLTPHTQAGIIEEMLEDTLEGMDDEEEMEEAAEAEVDKILFEITAGK